MDTFGGYWQRYGMKYKLLQVIEVTASDGLVNQLESGKGNTR